MRVRTLELRLIGLVLAACWVVAAAEVLIGYRPGGPADVAVGVAALVPSVVALAGRDLAARRPRRPRVRGDGLARRRLAAPARPLDRRRGQPARRPRRPDAPAVGRGGLSVGARAHRDVPVHRLRDRPSPARLRGDAPAPGLPGRADRDVLRRGERSGLRRRRDGQRARAARPDRDRRRGSARRTSSTIRRAATAAMGIGTSAQLQLHLDGTLDGKPARDGRPVRRAVRRRRPLARLRRDEPRARPVRRGDDRRPVVGPDPARPAGAGRRPTRSPTTTVDLNAFRLALSPEARAAAESRGVEVIEGAPARHCRVAIDGPTFLAAFPQASFLVGDADLARWRGQLDYWVFLDGQLGQIAGSVNGDAADIEPGALQATVQVDLTATIATVHHLTPPARDAAARPRRGPRGHLRSSGGDDGGHGRGPGLGEARPPGPADAARRPPQGPPGRDAAAGHRAPGRLSVRTVYRDLRAIEGELGHAALGARTASGGSTAEAFLPPLKLTQERGDGRRPVGAADGPLRRQVRPGPRGRVREARARSCRRRSPSTSTGPSTTCRRRRATSASAATSGS